MIPAITDDISFQKISSPLGTATPDGALCNRDKIMAGFVKKINPNYMGKIFSRIRPLWKRMTRSIKAGVRS